MISAEEGHVARSTEPISSFGRISTSKLTAHGSGVAAGVAAA